MKKITKAVGAFLLLWGMSTNMNAKQVMPETSGEINGQGSWTTSYAISAQEAANYPFTLSDAPSSYTFADNTHWYYLKLNNKYASYNEKYSYIPLSQNKSTTLNYLWAFVSSSDGKLKVYNAATGAAKVLTSPVQHPSTDQKNNPTWVQLMEETTDNITTWNYKYSENNASIFFLYLTDESTNKYFNDLATWSKIGFWTADNDGSQLTVEEVSDADLTAAITAAQTSLKASVDNAPDGVVGSLTATSREQFYAALENSTINGILEATRIKEETGEIIPFDSKKFYRLQNVYRSTSEANTPNNILGADANGLIASEMNKEDASLLWKIETSNEANSTVKLYHANAQKSAEAIGNSGDRNVQLTTDGADYTLTQWSRDQYGFKIGSNYLVQFSDNKIGSWNEGGEGSDHAWYILPAENIDVNITAAGYATVNYPFAVQVPEEVTAYTGTADATKQVFALNKIENGIIPANTPVVLEGAEGTHTLTILADNNDQALESGLEGTLLSKEITEDNAYILGKKGNSEAGFYQMDATDRTLGANKAYLVLPQEASAVRSIIFSDGTTTGIESTVAEGAETEEYYDLQGRRVMNPTKGIYVTKSGKKVLINK